MHNWAKRGLQAALVTGGMLMLGTGIASADERVDPDVAPSPLDGGVSVPVKVGNISLGTPIGQEDVPVIIDETISTGDLLKEASAPAAPYLKGNVVAPNALAPVEAGGWAVAAGGDAHNVNESTTNHSQGGDIATSGEGDGLAGNVVAPTAVAPAQVTGIAFPLLGTATVDNTTDQSSTAGGSVETNGEQGAGSGNIVAPQVALPAAVNNTAAGWFAGVATVNGSSTQSASAPGTRETSGDGSVLSGNIASAPAAGPAHVDGTAASWGGIATNHSQNASHASAGASGAGYRGAGDPYATTSGDDSVGGGNAATPQLAPLATVDCTAGAWVGISSTECTDENSSDVGGDVTSSGNDSLVGGNIADAPLTVPATVNDTAGAWGGMADAKGSETTTTSAGGVTESAGDDSTLGGNIVGAPGAGPVSVDCTAGAWGGVVSSECAEDTVAEGGNAPEAAYYATTTGDDSTGGGNIVTAQPAPLAAVDCTAGVWGGETSTECVNDTTAEAGGGNMTAGDDSTVGGNIVDAATAVPAEGYSNAGAWIGEAEAVGDKSVLADAGGMMDTSGEDSTVGGNVAEVPLAAPTAVDCNAPVWGGESSTECVTESVADAGANTHTNGEDSLLGGNVAQSPLSPVTSASGNAGSWIGDSEAIGDSTTTSEAGADTFTQGDGSTGGGNVADVPVATAEEVVCVAGTWVGEADCTGDNTVDSTAGGYTGTTGDDSTVGGNVAETPFAPVAEGFGVAGAWGGDTSSTFAEDKEVTAGGATTSNDDNGTVSSNIATVPWAPAAQVSNIAAAWIGNPTSVVDSDTKNTAGGDVDASANESVGSGNIVEAPAALPADVHTIAATWGGNAIAEGTHNTESTGGGTATTTSDNSALSGNIAGAQGAGAANVYGWAASWIGNNLADSDKTLASTAGGDTATSGDNGSLSGNQVLADANPVAGVFGNAASFVANDTANTTSVTDVTSGGDAMASGDGGNGAGNVVQADAQPLAQVFGINAAAVGSTLNDVDQTTTATNGGDVETSGVGGNLAGDIVDADAQAPWQVFGIEAAALGNPVNQVAHQTAVVNSGDNTAIGDGGNFAGDVVNADAQWPAQVFGLDASAAGNGVNTVSDSLSATNGGDTTASGVDGAFSGDILTGQAQAMPQVAGFGVGAIGEATQATLGDTSAVNGGDNTTTGSGDQFSGHIVDPVATLDPATFGWAAAAFGNVINLTDNSISAGNGGTDTSDGGEVLQVPVGFAPQINAVTIPIAATIVNQVTNDSNILVANSSATMLPETAGLLQADSLPLAAARASRDNSLATTQMIPAVTDGLPGVGSIGGADLTDGLPGAGSIGGLHGMTSGLSGMTGSGLPGRSHTAVPTESDGMPLMPSVNTGQTNLPDAGSLSGTLPLAGLPIASNTPAMSGLDTAQLHGLLGGFPTV